MSSWLTNTVMKQFPGVGAVEMLDGAIKEGQQTRDRCSSWVAQNSAHHVVLRDTLGAGSASETLELAPHHAIITDRDLRIVWRGDFDAFDAMQGELAKLR